MWMDIAIGLIFVLSTASGFRKGFVRTFIHTAGWVLSIIVGFVFFSRVENFLRANTNFYDNIYNKISGQIEAGGSSAIHTLTTDMPLILQEVIDRNGMTIHYHAIIYDRSRTYPFTDFTELRVRRGDGPETMVGFVRNGMHTPCLFTNSDAEGVIRMAKEGNPRIVVREIPFGRRRGY
jgi:hypothetical protein